MTMQEAHERIEQVNNEIAKLQEEIKRLQEIEDEPDIQRVGVGEPFWYIQLGDYGVNVIQCNEPTGRSCYDITETIGARLFRNSNYFLSKERAEQVAEKIDAVLKVERMHDAFCPELVDGTEENAYYVGLSLKYHEFVYVPYRPQETPDVLIVAKFGSSEVATKVCQILDRKKDNEKKR